MINITWGRFLFSFIVGYFVTSLLNWGAAVWILNPIVTPMFDGFMRATDNFGGGEVVKMTFGFMAPVFVSTLFIAMIDKPAHWFARSIFVGVIISIAAFYGVYSFISGWGDVLWVPLMITATCDLITLTGGLLVVGYIQDYKKMQ